MGSDKSAWAPQLTHFGASRRTIALDYPGYGESDPLTPGPDPVHDRLACAILDALDALGVEQMHLCGLSLGGVIAVAIAHRAPARLASLILCDSFAIHPDGAAILARSLDASEDMVGMARDRVPALLAAGNASPLAASLEGVMATIDPAAFRLGAAAVWPVDQRDRAAAILAPTLVLCGSEDRVTPPGLSDQLADLIAGARRIAIAQAGHLPNLEQSATFNAAVENFILSVQVRRM